MPSNFLQTTHRDIAWLKAAHDSRTLEMRPPFQRNLVWSDKQKSYLIDTILRGYPVPELYIQDLVGETGEKQYIVVDGQQRVTACLDFISGEFVIDEIDSPSFANLSFDDLTVSQKKGFYSYQFVVRLLPEITDTELRDIFQRLNRNNIALNSQELRQATYWGPFIVTMNEISEWDLWGKIGLFTNNDIKRMLDVEYISELVIAFLHGLQNKKTSLDRYYQLYEEDFSEKSRVKETFDTVLREILSLLPDIGNTRWKKKTDFYTLFLLLAKYRTKFPLPPEIRLEVSELLKVTGVALDTFLASSTLDGPEPVASSEIVLYAANVRASSDLGARRKREDALDAIIGPLLSGTKA